jgi:tetratricopeptide (TPR) repeat protein
MAGLDAKELLHLGLHASQHDDPAKAIDYLKQCLALEPENADATYLLGALYAQIGIYDRARETLARAVDLNGSQTTAIFQLGLLHLSSGDVGQAAHVWARLDTLSEDHSFNLFRRGLLALANDDFAQCVSLLERGIEANTFNEALNNDMQRLKASAEAAKERSAAPMESPSATEGVSTGQHLLGSYRQKNRH